MHVGMSKWSELTVRKSEVEWHLYTKDTCIILAIVDTQHDTLSKT
jgi:hypothetical protein